MKQQIKWWLLLSVLVISVAGSLGCMTTMTKKSLNHNRLSDYPAPAITDHIIAIGKRQTSAPEKTEVVLVGEQNSYVVTRGAEQLINLALVTFDHKKLKQAHGHKPQLFTQQGGIWGDWNLEIYKHEIKIKEPALTSVGFIDDLNKFKRDLSIQGKVSSSIPLSELQQCTLDYRIPIAFYDPNNAEVPLTTEIANGLLLSGTVMADLALAPVNLLMVIFLPHSVGYFFNVMNTP